MVASAADRFSVEIHGSHRIIRGLRSNNFLLAFRTVSGGKGVAGTGKIARGTSFRLPRTFLSRLGINLRNSHQGGLDANP